MEPKALPVNLTDEELLALSQKNESNQAFEDDVYFFVSAFNLQVGQNKVALDFLYSIYLRWSKKKTSKNAFSVKLKEVFPSETIEKKLFVLLDSSVAAITKNMVDLTVDPVINNQKRAGIRLHMEQFVEKLEVVAAKTWVGEATLYEIYTKWCATSNKKTLKKEDFLDALDVLFVGRFNKKNQREFALQLKEGDEKETPVKQETT